MNENRMNVSQGVVPAKVVRRGPPSEIRRSTRHCVTIFRDAWIARHPGQGAGTFRCGAEGANVIRRENGIFCEKNTFGLKKMT